MICLRSGFLARRFAVWCCLFFVAFCIDAAAQSASQNSGIQPLGTYSSSFDNVNLGSLSVHYDIPLFSRKERGSGNDVIAHFVYNSGFFSGYNNPESFYYGWSLLLGNSSSSHGHAVETNTPSPCIGSPDAQNLDFAYYVIDPTGYSHRFAGNYDEDCSGLHNMPLPQPTSDNSGYMLIAANRLNYTIATPSGHQLVCSSNGVDDDDCTDTDSNGNSSHLHYYGSTLDSFRDPAGSYLNISGFGSDTDPVIVTYKDTNGTQQQVKILYQRFPVTSDGTVNPPFPTKVLYPDGSSYQFSYEVSAYYPGEYTGRLSSVTVPTGGTISYTYTDGTSSCGNPHAMVVGLDRVTADGTTHYTSSITSGTCLNYTSETVVTDPVRTATYDFVTGITGQLEVGHTIHAGTSNSDPVLESTIRCYNGMTSNCQSTTLPYAPITQIDTTTSRDGGSASRHVEYLNLASLPTEVDEYDYGAPSPTRKTITTYASLGNYISDRVQSVVVKDGSNNVVAETTYGYDEFALAPTSNLPNHGGVSGSRGNRTSQHVWLNTSGWTLDTNWQYDDAGQVVKVQDPRLNWTSFGYDTATDSCLISTIYPVQVNGASLSASASCDAYTGLRSTSTDFNNVTTTYSYDAMLRPTGSTATSSSSTVAKSKTDYTWNPSGRQVITTTTTATPTPDEISSKTLDGYGRVYQEVLANNATVVTSYDGLGRVHSVTNPYFTTSDPTYGVTAYDYDALGRPTITTKPDGATLQYCYSNLKTDNRQTGCLAHRLSSAVAWVDEMDESGKKWQRVTDGLGRMTDVYEDPSGLSLHTQYGYNLRDNLVSVTQSGQSNELPRVRSFVYDLASRLTSSQNPETGTISYSYINQFNHLCAGNAESVCIKTDARGVKSYYSYDAMNRLNDIDYSDGTPSRHWRYDNTPGWGGTYSGNSLGHLTQASTDPVNGAGTVRVFDYDAVGRVRFVSESLPSEAQAGGYHTTKFAYDLAGDVTDLWYPDTRHVTQEWTLPGRLKAVKYADWNNQSVNYVYTDYIQYAPDGSVKILPLGNGVNEQRVYNKRLQATAIGAVETTYFGQLTLLSKEYCYACLGGGNNGNLNTITDDLNSSRTQSFTYDSLNRLKTFTSVAENQTYTYDSFGNLQQSGTLSFQPAYNTADNRANLGGYVYDASGNLQSTTGPLGTTTFSYNPDGHITSINSGNIGSYQYDADGNRIRKNANGSWTEYAIANGVMLAEKHSDGSWSDYIYANGRKIARADSYDQRVHLHGTRCDPNSCGAQTAAWRFPVLGYTIRSGDKISWRQYQGGSAIGGLSLQFTNGVNTNWNTHDTNGEVMNNLSTHGMWSIRTVDLSPFVGATLGDAWIGVEAQTGAGAWDEWFGEIAIYSTDGTVLPIYNRADSMSLSPFGSSGMTNLSASVERSNSDADAKLPSYNTTYYLSDHLGSAAMEVSAQGWPTALALRYPFGQTIWDSTLGNYKFTGKERDAESGLDYFGARYYSSMMGRWMSPDWATKAEAVPYGKLDDPQTLNLYAYVGNNPLSQVDADGHYASPWHFLITFVAAIATGHDPIRAGIWGVKNAMVDRGTQGTSPAMANIHGMGGTGQDTQAAYQGTVETLRAERAAGNIPGEQHTIQDADSESHNYSDWSNGYGGVLGYLKHQVNDWIPMPWKLVEAIVHSAEDLNNRNPNADPASFLPRPPGGSRPLPTPIPAPLNDHCIGCVMPTPPAPPDREQYPGQFHEQLGN